MIAVDTSALMAVLLREPGHESCSTVLARPGNILICAGTLTEALIVAARRNVGVEMGALVEQLGLSVRPVTDAVARRAAAAYSRWGKGVHPAGLNFGDCFAYAIAEEHDCPLLYVGEDFAKTDLTAAAMSGAVR